MMNRLFLLSRVAKARNFKNCLFSTSSSSTPANGFSFPAPRSLDSLVERSLLEKESPSKIRSIWQDYHASKDDVCAETLDSCQFNVLRERGEESKFFVMPVFRPEGMFTLLTQFQESHFLVTYLEAFKKNPANSPPYLTISLYDELLENKEIGLLRADIAAELSQKEASLVFRNIIDWYTNDEKYDRDVRVFNHSPKQFDFESFLNSYRK